MSHSKEVTLLLRQDSNFCSSSGHCNLGYTRLQVLVETLISLGKNVIVVVKGAPVINDATVEDAIESGLTHVCDVIDNGSEAVGTILQWTSSEFQKIFKNTQLVVSKGQGNFETLLGTRGNLFFLFQSKCHVVSQELNLPIGSMILKKSLSNF